MLSPARQTLGSLSRTVGTSASFTCVIELTSQSHIFVTAEADILSPRVHPTELVNRLNYDDRHTWLVDRAGYVAETQKPEMLVKPYSRWLPFAHLSWYL